MSGTERRISATEARVRFGELLDGAARHDVLIVARAGKEVAVVVSIDDWKAAQVGRADKWAQAKAMLAFRAGREEGTSNSRPPAQTRV